MAVQPTAQDTELALARTSAEIVPTAAAVLALLYAAIALGHWLLLPPTIREPLLALALGTAVVCGALALLWRGYGAPHFGHRAVATMALFAGLNTAVHLWLQPLAQNATNHTILLLGLGLLVNTRRWFYPLAGRALGSWFAIGELRGIADVEFWSWQLLFAATVAVIAHEQRRRTVRSGIAREGMLRQHAEVLQTLMHAPELGSDRSEPVLERILADGARTLGVARAGVWRFDANADAITSVAQYDELGPGAAEFARRLTRDEAPEYFAALESERTIAAEDARDHDATRELHESYLEKLGVAALLDSPILVDGSLLGVLCLEHRGGERRWTLEEQSFAASLASLAALAIQSEERARLERRTQTAERLESLGLLAGGVAHDFNNLLTAVLGNAELAASQLGQEHPVRADVDGIIDAAARAADLARQMLAYSGRAAFVTQAVDMNRVARELVESWTRNDPRSRPTELELGDCVPLADADPIQVVQILLNLLGNAAEAGAESIVVRTGRVTLDEAGLSRCVVADGIDPGDYVFIEAQDDGEGMDAETAERIFEPFFTTKRLGHGLGLAAALGMMRVHGGTIELETAPGRGTRLRFLFRLSAGVERVAVPILPKERHMSAPMEAGNILVVEDEPLVRSLLGNFLKKAGHSMDAIGDCADLERRLDVMQLHTFNAAMVDLTLPDGDGIDVVRQLRQKRADLPVVVMSGYDGTQALARLGNTDRVEFLSKPFTKRQLLETLDQVTA